MIEHGITHQFIKPNKRNLYFVADSVEAAMAYLKGDH
jgi:hypothetical protein